VQTSPLRRKPGIRSRLRHSTGTFDNLWTVTFDSRGKCTVFRMWNNQRDS
jgi:hypothetical protein